MKTIILASESPRRKKLLKQLGLEFKVIPSEIEEKLNARLQPRKQVEVLSLQKAEAVAAKVKIKDVLIIGADTMVSINNEIIGKPKDVKDARQMLKKLSGKKHSVITAFTIIDKASKKTVTKSVETHVWFGKMNDVDIKHYILSEKPYDKAGGYGIQGLGAVFVERIDGEYSGTVGLPLYTLAKELKKFGVKIL